MIIKRYFHDHFWSKYFDGEKNWACALNIFCFSSEKFLFSTVRMWVKIISTPYRNRLAKKYSSNQNRAKCADTAGIYKQTAKQNIAKKQIVTHNLSMGEITPSLVFAFIIFGATHERSCSSCERSILNILKNSSWSTSIISWTKLWNSPLLSLCLKISLTQNLFLILLLTLPFLFPSPIENQ